MNVTALAYLGDAVYELFVRSRVLADNPTHIDQINRRAVRYVRADGQAKVVRAMLRQEFLTEEEAVLVRRARNRRVTSSPRYADPVDYKLATAFEALLGQLYLDAEQERLQQIMEEAARIVEAAE